MANYLTLVEQLSTAVEQLNQVLQGDETTTVDINGKVQPSVQKKTLDEVTAKVQLVLDAAADIDSVKYTTTSAGIAATTDGQFFSVVSSDPENYLDLYKNESGVPAFNKSYPSVSLINSLLQKLTEITTRTKSIQTPFIGDLSKFERVGNTTDLSITTKNDLWWVDENGSHGTKIKLANYILPYAKYMWFDSRVKSGDYATPQSGSSVDFLSVAADPQVQLFAANFSVGINTDIWCALNSNNIFNTADKALSATTFKIYPDEVSVDSNGDLLVKFNGKTDQLLTHLGVVFLKSRGTVGGFILADSPAMGDRVYRLKNGEALVVDMNESEGDLTLFTTNINSTNTHSYDGFSTNRKVIILGYVTDGRASTTGRGVTLIGTSADYAQTLFNFGAKFKEEPIKVDINGLRNNGMTAFTVSANPPVFDPATKTLSWLGEIIIPFSFSPNNNSTVQSRIKIPEGSLDLSEYSGGYWQAVVDVSKLNSTKIDVIDITDIEILRYYVAGDLTSDKYLVLFSWSNGLLEEKSWPLTIGTPKWPNVSDTSVIDPNEIIVKVLGAPTGQHQKVYVYYKGSKADSKRYIKWQFQRAPNAEINSNVWHTYRAWEVELENGVEKQIRNVITHGENDHAVKEMGKPDFMGGIAHGDDETIWFYMKMDGSEIDPTVTATYYGSQFELVQLSQMYEEGTSKTVNFSKNHRRYRLDRTGLELQQIETMEKDAGISAWYHTLWCVNRPHSPKLARAPMWDVEDGTEGHPIIHSFTNQAMAWGDDIQFEAVTHSTKNGLEITPRLFFQATAPYNKFYFDLKHAEEQDMSNLVTGDVIATTHKYVIKTNN